MGLQEIDAYLAQSQPSATPPPTKAAGGGLAGIDAYLGGQGLGIGESLARGFMGSIPAQIALAMAKRGIVAQAGEIPPTEELPPPGEIAAAARKLEADLALQERPGFLESVARGLGTITGDLPFYMAGGYGAASLAKPLLSRVPPLLAKVTGRLAGSIGAFEAPAIIREAAVQAGEGEFKPGRFAKEMGIGGVTGAGVGVASLIPNPFLRVPAEVVAMVGAESLMREGRLPTFRDMLEGGFTIAVLQAAFRLAGLAFPGGERAGGPIRGTESPDFKGAMEAQPLPVSRLPGPPAPPGATTAYARPRRLVPEILREAVEGRRPVEAEPSPPSVPGEKPPWRIYQEDAARGAIASWQGTRLLPADSLDKSAGDLGFGVKTPFTYRELQRLGTISLRRLSEAEVLEMETQRGTKLRRDVPLYEVAKSPSLEPSAAPPAEPPRAPTLAPEPPAPTPSPQADIIYGPEVEALLQKGRRATIILKTGDQPVRGVVEAVATDRGIVDFRTDDGRLLTGVSPDRLLSTERTAEVQAIAREDHKRGAFYRLETYAENRVYEAEQRRLDAESAAPPTEPAAAIPTPARTRLEVGDPVEYRPKLSDRPITGAVSHVNADGTVNIRARAGGVIRNVPAEKITPLLTPDEVGLDSQRIGKRVALGPDDKAVLGEMRQTLRDVGGEVGQRIFLEGGEVGRGGDVTVKGFKTGKPSWMEIPDHPGEYYKYPEVIKVLESLRQGKWPKTAKQARIAEQLLQEVRFDAEEEKGRLASWERQALERETVPAPQPGREQAIQDSFFAEVDRLAAEEAGAVRPAPPTAPALIEGQRVAYTPPGERTAFPATIATGGVHADGTLTVKLDEAAGGKLVPYVAPDTVRPLVERARTVGAPGGVERRAGPPPTGVEVIPPREKRYVREEAESVVSQLEQEGHGSTVLGDALDIPKFDLLSDAEKRQIVADALRERRKKPTTIEAPLLREPPGTTLGSLGGAFQEAAGYLPESVRNLPAKYRSQIAQPAIDYITAKMPKVLKEARGLGQEVVDLRHDRGATLANYVERGIELSGKIHHGLTETQRARVDQVLRGGITTNPVVERLVAPLRELINELQAKLIKYGYLTPEDVQLFRERFTSHPEYLRRLYSSKLVPPEQPILAGEMTGPVGRGVKSEALMMRGDIQRVKLPLMGGEPLVGKQRADFLDKWTKPRKDGSPGYRLIRVEGDTATLFRDIPEVVRKAMGEIRGQPGFVAARTIAEQARIVANHEFLDGIRKSQDPNIRPKPTTDILDKQGRIVEAGITDAELASGEWTQLKGDKKKWGPLSDMHVRKDVALELESSIRLRADWEKVIGRLVGMWKFGKVIVNPAAMGRNVISSGILADFGGLHPWMVDEWAKGAADFAKQSGLWNEAKQMGLFRSTYTANEIMGLADGLARSNSSNAILRVLDGIHEITEATGKKTGIRPATLYGAIENFYRYNLYRYGREGMGLTPVEARRYSLKYAIDYEVVSPAVAALRGTGGGWSAPLLALHGAPFATFSLKAIPLTLETAALHPLRVGKYLALIYGVGKWAAQQIGMTEEEVKAQRELGSLNPMRYMLLPFRDKDGRALYFDLGYILPFGDMIELWDSLFGGAGRRANIALLPIVSSPTFAVAEAILNKSGFTGKELSAPSDTPLQSVQKRVGHIFQSWMPSLTPRPGDILRSATGEPMLKDVKGGFAYEDLRRAFATPPETDFLGRTRSPGAALLANVAGLRARGVTTAELANFKARQYDEMFKALDKEVIVTATRFQQNPEEANRRIADLKQRYIEIAKEAQALFGLIPPEYSRPGPSPPATRSGVPAVIQQAMGGRS